MNNNNSTHSDKVIETEALLRNFASMRTNWATESRSWFDFANGDQWTQEEQQVLRDRNQSPLVINVILPAVEQAIALLTTNKPEFSATGKEDTDTKTANAFSALLSHIWHESNGNAIMKKVIWDYYVKGMGCLMAYYDPNKDFGKGEVCLMDIEPWEVYFASNSKDLYCQDSSDVIVCTLHSADQINRMYPDFDLSQAQQQYDVQYSGKPTGNLVGLEGISVDQYDRYTPRYEVWDRYTKLKVQFIHAIDNTNNTEKVMNEQEFAEYIAQPAFIMTTVQGQLHITEPGRVNELMSVYQQTGGVFHYMQDPNTGEQSMMPGPEHEDPYAIPSSTTQLTPITIADVIEQGVINVKTILQDRIYRTLIIGRVVYYEGFIGNLSYYPIMPLMNRHARNPFPRSDVSAVKDLQKFVNKTRSLIVAHASNSVNVKVLLPRGSVDRNEFVSEWAKAGTAVLEVDMVDGVGQPIIVQPTPLPNELYKNEADARRDIQEILGIYALMQGDASQAPATYKGTVALDEYGQRRIRSKKDDIENFLNMMCKVVIEFCQSFYTDHKVIRLLKPNNITRETQVNQPYYDDLSGALVGKINDITVGKYDIIVVSGSMLPSNRWAQLEYYMDLYQAGIIDQVEVLKKTEVVDTEGVLERMSIINQLQAQLAQAQEEIKKLQGDMQTTDRENVHLAKKVEVERFKSDLKTSKNKAQMATDLFSRRLDDTLSLEKQKQQIQQKKAKPNGNR